MTEATETAESTENLGETPETSTAPMVEVPQEELDRVLRHHVYGAMGVGLVPIPVVDFAGVAGIQVNLVAQLAKMHEVEFSRERIRGIVLSIAGGAVPATLGLPLASALKAIPFAGTTLGVLSMPVVAGASTYAVGQVFIKHFASGGTFLTFDTEWAKSYYNEMFNKGKAFAESLRKEKKQEEPAAASEETAQAA